MNQFSQISSVSKRIPYGCILQVQQGDTGGSDLRFHGAGELPLFGRFEL